MKITVLNGSPRLIGNTARLVSKFKAGAESVGHSVEVVNVATMKISGCMGCLYCQNIAPGECAIKDDMQKVVESLKEAEVVVFASPVYYWSITGQLQSTLTRFYATTKPPKAKKYVVMLTSHSPDVYNAIKSQFNDVVDYLGGESVEFVTAYGDERTSEEKLQEVYDFGRRV